MQTQSGRTLHPLVWVAGVALIVFCGAGVAAMMGWIGGPSAKTVEPTPIGQARPAEKPHAAVKARVAAVCLECGVVQSVHEVDTKGAGSGVGAVSGGGGCGGLGPPGRGGRSPKNAHRGGGVRAVSGGLVRGVLGRQGGDGDPQTIAPGVAAVGGAVLGNEAEKQGRRTKPYEIAVGFDDGAIRMSTEPTAPSWHVGDKVK